MWLVDFIPFRKSTPGLSISGVLNLCFLVKYTPTWFPGARFKREALSIRKDVLAAFDIPFEMVKKKMVIRSPFRSPLHLTLW
jgi:hypothetical protein